MFKGQFSCLGENSEKYVTFSVPIKKKKNTNKNAREVKTILYKLIFIDSVRFTASSVSNVIDNLAGIHKLKCKYNHDNKKIEKCEIKYKDCECFLEYTNFQDDLFHINVFVETGFTKKKLIKT